VLGLGGADKASGNLLKARKFYEEAARLDPQNPQANFMMGDILAYQRKFVQAEPYAKAALHRDPSNLPLVHALLGKIYASQGLTARAIQELRQALPADDDGSLHYQIAMVYKRMGDSPAEREALEESEALRKNYDNGSQKTTQSPRWFARGASGKP
jgi:predicted Zn-dependent protease